MTCVVSTTMAEALRPCCPKIGNYSLFFAKSLPEKGLINPNRGSKSQRNNVRNHQNLVSHEQLLVMEGTTSGSQCLSPHSADRYLTVKKIADNLNEPCSTGRNQQSTDDRVGPKTAKSAGF
jgi:hypothetical protein